MNAAVSPTRRRDDTPANTQEATGPAWVTSRSALPTQPVVLQIAPRAVDTWTDVVRFDMRDHDACGVIEYHAPGVAVVGRARLRVVTDTHPIRVVKRSWSIETGWVDVDSQGGSAQ